MAGPSLLTQTHLVEESFVHIFNPVGTQALKAILERLGYLDFFDEEGNAGVHVISDFSSTSKSSDDNGNATISTNRVRAKLSPNINPASIKWEGSGTTVAMGNGNGIVTNNNGSSSARLPGTNHSFNDRKYSILHDGQYNIDLKEMSIGASLSMDVTCDFCDATKAADFLGRIYQCLRDGDMIGYVDIQYDYPIPLAIQNTMVYLYGLIGKRSTTDTCFKWATEMSNGNITTVEHRDARQRKEVVINKNNFQAMYQVDCSMDFPQPATPSGATVQFTMTVQFARADRLILQYPIVVNNQFVDFDYVPVEPEYRLGTSSPIMWDNIPFTRYWQDIYVKRGPIAVHYPWWDKWEVPTDSIQFARRFRSVAIIAFTLDHLGVEGGETEIDLINGLPGFELTDDIVQEIKYKRSKLLLPNDRVNIAVFVDDAMLGVEEWTDGYKPFVDLDDGRHLKIRGTRNDSIYRLVISINDHPINLTNRPLSYQIHPSWWLDVTMPTYRQSVSGTALANTTYYYWDDANKVHVAIPSTMTPVGRKLTEVKAILGVNVLYEQEPPLIENGMEGKYEEVDTHDESDIIINEAKIGTPSGQAYCYRTPTVIGRTVTAAEDSVQLTNIDLKAVCTAIREDDPSKTNITLADVRSELELPTVTQIMEVIAPELEEPIETPTTQSESYINSSRGRNVNNVWRACIHTGRPGIAFTSLGITKRF